MEGIGLSGTDAFWVLGSPYILGLCEPVGLNNEKFASYYDDNQFSILTKGRTLFHLSTLEATIIKMLKLELRRQKDFVYTLKLHH